MNKRQRKKNLTRYYQREAEMFYGISQCFYNEWMSQVNHLMVPHARRHWMSRSELQHRKDVLLADIAVRKAADQEKSKTHVLTLGGWIPKEHWGNK